MIASGGYAGERVAVLGLGCSGIAVVRALRAGGACVAAWDDAPAARGAASDAILAQPGSAAWNAAKALVVAPGVPLRHPRPHEAVVAARQAGWEVLGDMELFCRALRDSGTDARVVAITGTNGKSTATALTGHLLRAAGEAAGDAAGGAAAEARPAVQVEVGGNIGVPVLDLPDPRNGMVYVLEVSSFQIDLAPGLAPQVAVQLNVSPDHLDRHGSLEDYAAVKAQLFAGQGAGDTAVVGVDDRFGRDLCSALRDAAGGARVMPVSGRQVLEDGVGVTDGVLHGPRGRAIPLSGAPRLAGAHNWQNAAAAWAAACALDLRPPAPSSVFGSFAGLPHRMEPVRSVDGVLFVNDSKATNAAAAACALGAYERIHWIVGGVAKAGGIGSLTPWFARIAHAYLIGESAADFARTLEAAGMPCGRYASLEGAVAAAAQNATHDRPGAVVLLSPACASFDQFTGFAARGETFRAAVDDVAARRNAGGAAA